MSRSQKSTIDARLSLKWQILSNVTRALTAALDLDGLEMKAPKAKGRVVSARRACESGPYRPCPEAQRS